MSTLKIKRPLDETIIKILEVVVSATRELGLDCFLVGATARDIILTNVFDIDTGRATRDIDFAVAVESWEQFEAIKKLLEQKSGFKAAEKIKHRLYFYEENTEHGYPVDLIPFGEVEEENGTLVWPPDMTSIMNVIGYKEVLEASVLVEIAENLIVNIASLPGLAVLKLFAWLDRGESNSKDAQDLYLILQQYNEAGHNDRLYEDEFSLIESCDGNPNLAGAQLLGKDIARLVKLDTYNAIMQILNDEKTLERLTAHMAKAKKHHEEAESEADKFIQKLKTGLQAQSGTD